MKRPTKQEQLFYHQLYFVTAVHFSYCFNYNVMPSFYHTLPSSINCKLRDGRQRPFLHEIENIHFMSVNSCFVDECSAAILAC